MSTFQRGQKSKLEDLTPATKIEVGVSLGNPRGLDIDVSCFGLDEAGKLSDDRYFIFYNQPKSPCGGVAMETRGGFDKIFDVDLSRLPGNIKKLVFAATIDGGGEMSQISGSELVV
ncbi:MAG: TerD family protein, partial [Myxococcales bacterium]|nr:TerD family protein [Myxococcales bacterium]